VHFELVTMQPSPGEKTEKKKKRGGGCPSVISESSYVELVPFLRTFLTRGIIRVELVIALLSLKTTSSRQQYPYRSHGGPHQRQAVHCIEAPWSSITRRRSAWRQLHSAPSQMLLPLLHLYLRRQPVGARTYGFPRCIWQPAVPKGHTVKSITKVRTPE
jgi:hypothetical protein